MLLIVFKKSHRDALRRIVITSSSKAIIGPDNGRTYTEDDWADYVVKEVEEKGRDVTLEYIYDASKLLAERGASRHDLYTFVSHVRRLRSCLEVIRGEQRLCLVGSLRTAPRMGLRRKPVSAPSEVGIP